MNILADFLRKNRAEAIHMSIFEYDEEKELALLRKDEYNAGVEAGIAKGHENGRIEGREEGIKEVALHMLLTGNYTLEEIVSVSGLDREAVRKLETDNVIAKEKI